MKRTTDAQGIRDTMALVESLAKPSRTSKTVTDEDVELAKKAEGILKKIGGIDRLEVDAPFPVLVFERPRMQPDTFRMKGVGDNAIDYTHTGANGVGARTSIELYEMGDDDVSGLSRLGPQRKEKIEKLLKASGGKFMFEDGPSSVGILLWFPRPTSAATEGKERLAENAPRQKVLAWAQEFLASKPRSWREATLISDIPPDMMALLKKLPQVMAPPSPIDDFSKGDLDKLSRSGYLGLALTPTNVYLVDTSGYDYARYVARLPKSILNSAPAQAAPAPAVDKNRIIKALDIVINLQKAQEAAAEAARKAVKDLTALGYDRSLTDWVWDSNTATMGSEHLIKLATAIKAGKSSRTESVGQDYNADRDIALATVIKAASMAQRAKKLDEAPLSIEHDDSNDTIVARFEHRDDAKDFAKYAGNFLASKDVSASIAVDGSTVVFSEIGVDQD